MRRVDLNSVKTCLFHSFGSGSEVLHDLMDLVDRDLAGKIHAERILDRGRGDRLHVPVDVVLGLAARMIHLAEELGVVFVDRLRQLPVALDLLVVVKARDELVALRVLVDRIVFRDDHAPAALGLLLDILDVPLCDHPVFRAQVHDHGRHDQPVGDHAVSDLSRCKKFRHHFHIPPHCSLKGVISYVKRLTDGTVPRSMPKKRRAVR